MPALTDAERDHCHAVQDRLIAACEARGFADHIRLSPDLPPGMTVGGLRSVLFPKFVAEMEALLEEITDPCPH